MTVGSARSCRLLHPIRPLKPSSSMSSSAALKLMLWKLRTTFCLLNSIRLSRQMNIASPNMFTRSATSSYCLTSTADAIIYNVVIITSLNSCIATTTLIRYCRCGQTHLFISLTFWPISRSSPPSTLHYCALSFQIMTNVSHFACIISQTLSSLMLIRRNGISNGSWITNTKVVAGDISSVNIWLLRFEVQNLKALNNYLVENPTLS